MEWRRPGRLCPILLLGSRKRNPDYKVSGSNYLLGKIVSLGSEACTKKEKGQRAGDARVERPGVGSTRWLIFKWSK